MNELKVRFWDTILAKMYTPEMDEREPNLWRMESMSGGLIKSEKGVYMLFTESFDIEKDEIYVDDILEVKHSLDGIYKKYTARVIFDKSGFGFYTPEKMWLNLSDIESFCRKIIGNVFEDEELLNHGI